MNGQITKIQGEFQERIRKLEEERNTIVRNLREEQRISHEAFVNRREKKFNELQDAEAKHMDMFKMLTALPEYRDEKQIQAITLKLDYLNGLATQVRATLKAYAIPNDKCGKCLMFPKRVYSCLNENCDVYFCQVCADVSGLKCPNCKTKHDELNRPRRNKLGEQLLNIKGGDEQENGFWTERM